MKSLAQDLDSEIDVVIEPAVFPLHDVGEVGDCVLETVESFLCGHGVTPFLGDLWTSSR
jgi:hypothetical protein